VNEARAGQFIAVGAPLLGLVFVIALFALDADVRPYFFTWRNAILIFSQTAVIAVGALGMTMIIVSGGIDLSVGSAVALSSVVCGTLLLHGAPEFAAAAAAVCTGALVGLGNGAAIGYLRMVPFIVTLGMMGIARGCAKWLAGNQTVNPGENGVVALMSTLGGAGGALVVPVGVWVVLALAVAIGVVMTRSVFGRHVYAIGSNEAAARLCGIRVPRVKLWIYALAGALFGFAGVLQFARLTQGDPTVAIGLELDVIAAVVLGGASLSGGTGSVLGAMIGALIMAVLRNGSNQMGWPNYVQEIIIGGVIILAVGLDRLRLRKE
jgi:ribose transport system permease protein